jgi:hypothetical protein
LLNHPEYAFCSSVELQPGQDALQRAALLFDFGTLHVVTEFCQPICVQTSNVWIKAPVRQDTDGECVPALLGASPNNAFVVPIHIKRLK